MLTLFHDYSDPASAVAVARLERLVGDGLAVEFVGFEAVGVDARLPTSLDVLAALERLDVAARQEGVVLRRPADLPPTAAAHVVGELAEDAGVGAGWRRACYEAFWRDDADIAEPAVLGELGAAVGLERDRAEAAARDRRRLARFRQRVAGHRRDGVGGVPTILAHRTLVPGLLAEADLRALAGL